MSRIQSALLAASEGSICLEGTQMAVASSKEAEVVVLEADDRFPLTPGAIEQVSVYTTLLVLKRTSHDEPDTVVAMSKSQDYDGLSRLFLKRFPEESGRMGRYRFRSGPAAFDE